ncbi:IS3 family transposase [uncultured Clostridium sp.]
MDDYMDYYNNYRYQWVLKKLPSLFHMEH